MKDAILHFCQGLVMNFLDEYLLHFAAFFTVKLFLKHFTQFGESNNWKGFMLWTNSDSSFTSWLIHNWMLFKFSEINYKKYYNQNFQQIT